jgi:hypothetical protein
MGAVGKIAFLKRINIISSGSTTGSDLNLVIATGTVINIIAGSGSNHIITIQPLTNENIVERPSPRGLNLGVIIKIHDYQILVRLRSSISSYQFKIK